MTNEERVKMLTEILENTDKCYNAGIEDGKKSEWDTFWDNFQDYGKRTGYRYGFSGDGWNDETFKPKYLIQPKSSTSSIFEEAFRIKNSAYTDLLDFSKASATQGIFHKCYELEKLKIIDLRCSTSISQIFRACRKLISIDELYLPIGNLTTSDMFYQCYELTSIGIMSEIGVGGLDFRDCTKLNRETLRNLIWSLSNDTVGLSITFPLAAVAREFPGAGEGYGEWYDFMANKSNWTINLI